MAASHRYLLNPTSSLLSSGRPQMTAPAGRPSEGAADRDGPFTGAARLAKHNAGQTVAVELVHIVELIEQVGDGEGRLPEAVGRTPGQPRIGHRAGVHLRKGGVDGRAVD